MKKNITPDLHNSFEPKKVVVPSSKALAFIKQFARSYHVAKEIPSPISGICVN